MIVNYISTISSNDLSQLPKNNAVIILFTILIITVKPFIFKFYNIIDLIILDNTIFFYSQTCACLKIILLIYHLLALHDIN